MDGGPIFQQQPDGFLTPAIYSLVESGFAVSVFGVDLGPFFQQERDDFGAGVRRGEHQGGSPLLVSPVDPCPLAKQQHHYFWVRGFIIHREKQSGIPMIFPEADAGFPAEEQFHGLQVAGGGGLHQGGDAMAGWRIDLGPPRQKNQRHFWVFAIYGHMQRGASPPVPRVDIRATIGQQGHDFRIPPPCGPHEQGNPAAVP